MNRSKKYYMRDMLCINLKTAIITVFHIYSSHHCLELHNCDHYQSSSWGNLPARGSHRDLCRLEVSLLCWRSCYAFLYAFPFPFSIKFPAIWSTIHHSSVILIVKTSPHCRYTKSTKRSDHKTKPWWRTPKGRSSMIRTNTIGVSSAHLLCVMMMCSSYSF